MHHVTPLTTVNGSIFNAMRSEQSNKNTVASLHTEDLQSL